MWRLNLGCGRRQYSGFVNVDVAKDHEPDVVADACHLPFRNDVFSLVYSRRVIQHVQRQDQAVAEVHRVLKPGGVFVMVVWSSIGWLFYVSRLSPSRGVYPIHNMYTAAKLRRLLRVFAVVHVRKVRSRLLSFDYEAIAEKAEKRGN